MRRIRSLFVLVALACAVPRRFERVGQRGWRAVAPASKVAVSPVLHLGKRW